ncbi:F0F1 ATP synthase subunit B [Patescibacteria group bacterium]|nr:F0F1 ATP synthase subunit B [Patescibacteria group bacterium]
MDELIKTFHIDWKLMIAQIINFAIVLFVLYKFAIKPLSRTMEKRTKRIEKSLDDARQIEENLAKMERDKEENVLEAKKEARKIIEEAMEQGGMQGQQIVNDAKREVQTVISAAKEQIASEKSQMLKDVKAEVGGLVIAATKKILEKTGNKDVDRKLVEESLKDIKHG